MREILFRGKTDKGEWIEGQLLFFKASVGEKTFALIVESCEWDNSNEWFNLCKRAKVIPETIGQYTGLTDKNGTKIFEGDIHEHIVGGKSYLFVVKHGKYYDFEAADKRYGWYFQNTKTNDCNSFYGDEKDYANIIGNIHDNPELLKGGAE